MEKEKIKEHAQAISEILQKEFNPHVTVEINSEETKMTSVDWKEPTEVQKN